MNAGKPDPSTGMLTAMWRDLVGTPVPARFAEAHPPFRPLAVWAIITAILAHHAPRFTAMVGPDSWFTAAATELHNYRHTAVAVAVAAIVVDLNRFRRYRYRRILDGLVRHTTRCDPVRVRVALLPGFWALRSGTVRVPTATVIRAKELDELVAAIRKSGLIYHGQLLDLRHTILTAVARRTHRGSDRSPGWNLTVRHQPHRDRLIVTRTLVATERRSARTTLEQVVRDSALKDASVTVEDRDDTGTETSYRISFTPTMNTGVAAFQHRVGEAVARTAGEHPSGRSWVTDWHPDHGYLLLRLQAPLPHRENHQLDLDDPHDGQIGFATAADDLRVSWDVSSKSNKPHCLVVGPTGGGKTSVIRTLLTGGARRYIPFVGVDPKMVELDGLEHHPGCGAIVYDPVRAAQLVRALHAELMARNNYVHIHKIEPSELAPLIAVLDEFFILSGQWQRLMKSGDETTRQLLAELDPLGAWADLAVLARTAKIRLLLGVQRPDAALFGNSSGNARDNFGTRISLGNLSQDGALMLWGDAHIGRTIDTSIPGRGMVTGADGSPIAAQMWWTPNVDRHPNKWNQLSEADKTLVEALTPTEAPAFVVYSDQLREFLESERALRTRSRSDLEAPEPTVLGAATDDHADAIPASAVTAGTTVLIEDGHHQLVPVTVNAVDPVHNHTTGALIETRLILATHGRATQTATYKPHEVVFLHDPDTPDQQAA